MEELNKKLNSLYVNKNWDDAVSVVFELCRFLNIETEEDFSLISDNQKINANVGRFEKAFGFIDRPATYELYTRNQNIEIKDNYLEPLWILDGVPLYTEEEWRKIDMKNLSINIQKQKVIDCSGHAIYGGFIHAIMADSVHKGLKYILKKTNNWILIHPLADYEINGVVVNKDKTLKEKLFALKPEDIEEIEIVEPNTVAENCSNGLIRIKTK